MTTCCRSSGIKSSVYNQTGEGFFQQLTAYNHMTAHLRRILLAKSRVDSRNPSYLQRQQRGRCLMTDKSLNKSISQDIIDRLAYDTEHHPMDILKMGYNVDNHCEKYSRSQDRSRRNNGCNSSYIECPASRINSATIRQLESERSRSMSRTRIYGSGPSFHSARPGRSQRKNNSWRSRDEVDADATSSRHCGPISVNSSIRSSPRSSESKNENDPACSNYASSFESSSEASRRGSPVPKLSAPSPTPVGSTLSTQRQQNIFEETSVKFDKNDEEAKYSKFLYDITQEIVQHGFYTDDELRNVFRKHLKKNTHILDKHKMMYELYQLKLSLNIIDNDDEEENESVEQFLRNQKFIQDLTPKPPTPPKVLDENKLMDKLLSQEELREVYSKSPANGKNAVVLIDANPELLITERDILATLLEMNIEPKQAENVYRRLQKKSRDLSQTELVHQETKDTVKPSNLRRATPERHRIQSTHQDISYHGRYPMNMNKSYTMEKGESIIHRDCPSMVTLKYPCRGKRANNRPDDYSDRARRNYNKMCQCGIRMLEVRLAHCSDGYKTHSGPSSMKSKLLNEKKVTNMKGCKDKKLKKLVDNQLAYNPTRTLQRKTSSLSQLQAPQSDGIRAEKMKKNVSGKSEIKSYDRVQESTLREFQTLHNQDNEDIETDHMNLSDVAQVAGPSSQNKKEQHSMKLSNNITSHEQVETQKKSSAELDEIDEIHDDPDESVIESIDDDQSIEEENSSKNIEKSNNKDTVQSNVDSDMEQIKDRVQCDFDEIIGENTLTESQFQRKHGQKTRIHFLPREIVTNTETQSNLNQFIPEAPRICSCEQINSYNNFEVESQSQWIEYFYDENNNGLCDVNCLNRNRQTIINCVWEEHNNMVLCESCENIVTCSHT